MQRGASKASELISGRNRASGKDFMADSESDQPHLRATVLKLAQSGAEWPTLDQIGQDLDWRTRHRAAGQVAVAVLTVAGLMLAPLARCTRNPARMGQILTKLDRTWTGESAKVVRAAG